MKDHSEKKSTQCHARVFTFSNLVLFLNASFTIKILKVAMPWDTIPCYQEQVFDGIPLKLIATYIDIAGYS